MTDHTTKLKLPFILPSQAQKHVTHNEALLRLDALVHLTIIAEAASPPSAPLDGDGYLVASAATGAWSGKTGKIAVWQDGHWVFLEPVTGWRAWFLTEGRLRVFSGSAWQDIPLPDTGSMSRLGINAAADAANRLSLSSAASLFNHEGAGHQIKVNKAASADTASLLFQTNWTGYAEMGLAGDNRFSVKVSDGGTWKTGLSISPGGHVSRPNQPAARAYRSGSAFTPASGQQSGFTTFAFSQGGVALGSAAAAGGNGIVVPADGLYLLALNLSVASSSGHEVTLLANGTQTLTAVRGVSGATYTQSASGIFSLAGGDLLTLGHAGTATFEAGWGKTDLSLTLL